MKKSVLLFLIFVFVIFSSSLSAQDSGEPIVKDVARFTIYGALGGAALGVAIFFSDPLDDTKSIYKSAVIGMGLGAVTGFFFGVQQAYKRAVIPQSYKPTFDDILGSRNIIFNGKNDAIANYRIKIQPQYFANIYFTRF